jgi:hypothetical protein
MSITKILVKKPLFALLLVLSGSFLSGQTLASQTATILVVYGTVRYNASSIDAQNSSNINLHYGNPIKRAKVVLFIFNGTSWEFKGETRTWEGAPGYFQFPDYWVSGPVSLAIRVYAEDTERVGVVNPSNGQYYYKDISIGSGLSGYIYRDLYVGSSFYPDIDAYLGQAFYIFDLTANNGYNFLQNNSYNWNDNRKRDIRYPESCVPYLGVGDCYRGSVYLNNYDSGRETSLILHEYGHFVLSKYIGFWEVVNARQSVGYSHSPAYQLTDTCAWSEGWANFFQASVTNYPYYRSWGIENPYYYSSFQNMAQGDGNRNELTVASGLWDISDNNVDIRVATDQMQDGFNSQLNNGVFAYSTYFAPLTWSSFSNYWVAYRGSSCNYRNILYMNKLNWSYCSFSSFIPILLK